jgi:hypothetical protein
MKAVIKYFGLMMTLIGLIIFFCCAKSMRKKFKNEGQEGLERPCDAIHYTENDLPPIVKISAYVALSEKKRFVI